MNDVRRFEGTCDVCGEPISSEWNQAEGMIDYIIEDGRMMTWIRHYSVAPEGANPNCAVYSSRVYEVVSGPGEGDPYPENPGPFGTNPGEC